MSASRARKPTRELIVQNKGPGERSKADQAETRPVIEHLLIAGATDTEIAKQTGLDRKAIANLRKTSARRVEKDHFGHVQHGQEDDRVQAEILRLRAEGLTYVEIAEEVGLGWASVRSRLKTAYKDYMLEQRDAVAGRQVADLEMMRMELLEIIIRDYREDMEAVLQGDEVWDELDAGQYRNLLQRAYEKGRKNQDAKFQAMGVLLKVMEREDKLFTLSSDTVNVNHNITVKPEAIELLSRLQNREQPAIEAEIIDVEFEMGSM